MFDDVAALFHENVTIAYQDYIRGRTSTVAGRSQDLRLAINAATAIYHFREHLPEKVRPSRTQLEKKCSDYGLLGDVVNASKHGELTQRTPRVRRANDIQEMVVLTEYMDEQGTYCDSEKIISVKLTDGSTRELGEILTTVLNFWLSELHELNILPKLNPFALPTKAKPVSRKESESPNLEMIRGVRFKQRWQLMRYDYETGSTKPIDLTGAVGKFRIYKPAEVDLVLTHDKTGKSLRRTVLLNPDELKAFDQLGSDEQKQNYLVSLVQSRKALQEMAEEAKNTGI
jgi:hypothetical protein